MSIRNMEYVWHYAPYKGEKLLVLLALADWSNADGWAWPSYEKLAFKARVTERGAIGIIESLLTDGVLEVEKGGGRGISNRYRINLKLLKEKGEAQTVNEKQCFSNSETDDAKRVNVEAEKGERGDTPNKRTVIRTVIEPSVGNGGVSPPDLFSEDRMNRLGALFRRRPDTKWSEKELRLYRKLVERCPIEDFVLLEAYYGSGNRYCRHDLQTLLNNWSGEIDRAVKWDKEGRKIGSESEVPLQKQLQAIENQISTHVAWRDSRRYCGDGKATQAQRDDLADLRRRRDAVESKIARQ